MAAMIAQLVPSPASNKFRQQPGVALRRPFRPRSVVLTAAAGGRAALAAAGERVPGWLSLAAAAAILLSAPASHAANADAMFTKSCAGCHTGGGNIIRRDATLQLSDLQKFGVADTEALYKIIYSGKGSMPGFGAECAPRGQCTFGPRLADEDVQALAEYVLRNAEQGWPQ